MKKLLFLALIIVTITAFPQSAPTVTTTAATGVMSDYATSGGDVSSAGTTRVSSRGVCWATTTNPTISNNHTISGTDTGVFVSTLINLSAGTTYYVRAYATNSVGTRYGSNVTLTTTGNTRKGHTVLGGSLNSDQVAWKAFEADSEAIRVDIISGGNISGTFSFSQPSAYSQQIMTRQQGDSLRKALDSLIKLQTPLVVYRTNNDSLTTGDTTRSVFFQNKYMLGYLKFRSSPTANDSAYVEMYDTVGTTWEIVSVKRMNDNTWVGIINPNPSASSVTRTYQLPDYKPGTYRLRMVNVTTPSRKMYFNWIGKQ